MNLASTAKCIIWNGIEIMKYWQILANDIWHIHHLIEEGADDDTIEKSENLATKEVLGEYLQDLAREEAGKEEKVKEGK